MAFAERVLVGAFPTTADASRNRLVTGAAAVLLGALALVASGQVSLLAALRSEPTSVTVSPLVPTGRSVAEGATVDTPITIDEVLTGQVEPERFNRFWQAEVDRIASAPCVGTAPEAGRLQAVVGATPPPGNDALLDWAPAIRAAHVEHAERCGQG